MSTYLKSFILAGAAFVALSNCQKSNKDVREAARQSIEQQEAPVQPIQADAAGTQQAQQMPTGPVTTMTFTEDRFAFGTITSGEKVKHVFKFKNTGKEPLVISDARSTCGCTVPAYPREPIAPGKTGEIIVEFDSSGKGGSQSRRVTLVANTNPPETFLYMEGEVVDKANPGS